MWQAERDAAAALMFLDAHEDKFVPEPNTGCLIWTGATAGAPVLRPQVKIGGRKGKVMYVARIVCEEAYGPPPTPKHEAAHDTPRGCIGGLCVEAGHLRWATRTENENDKPVEERSQSRRDAYAARGQRTYDLPRGVTFNQRNQKYMVRQNGEYVGYFLTVEEAVAARDSHLGVKTDGA